MKMPKNEIAIPSNAEVTRWCELWDALENYSQQEDALYKLFHETYPTNDDPKDVLMKVAALNHFYSTHIFDAFSVAKHIRTIERLDERLREGDISLVDDIKDVPMRNGGFRNFYSFASKFCSHHNSEVFPIYDSYVDEILNYFKRKYNFTKVARSRWKNYSEFKSTLIEFKEHFQLECSLKDLDRYLWQLGKDAFPKMY